MTSHAAEFILKKCRLTRRATFATFAIFKEPCLGIGDWRMEGHRDRPETAQLGGLVAFDHLWTLGRMSFGRSRH